MVELAIGLSTLLALGLLTHVTLKLRRARYEAHMAKLLEKRPHIIMGSRKTLDDYWARRRAQDVEFAKQTHGENCECTRCTPLTPAEYKTMRLEHGADMTDTFPHKNGCIICGTTYTQQLENGRKQLLKTLDPKYDPKKHRTYDQQRIDELREAYFAEQNSTTRLQLLDELTTALKVA